MLKSVALIAKEQEIYPANEFGKLIAHLAKTNATSIGDLLGKNVAGRTRKEVIDQLRAALMTLPKE